MYSRVGVTAPCETVYLCLGVVRGDVVGVSLFYKVPGTTGDSCLQNHVCLSSFVVPVLVLLLVTRLLVTSFLVFDTMSPRLSLRPRSGP